MSFSIVAAIAKNNVIGKDNKLPWNIPEDSEHFYKLINDKVVVMGRKTYESIGGAIDGSENIVLSRNSFLSLPNCLVFNSVSQVLEDYKDSDQEIMVMGGSPIYEQFLPFVSKMYLTFIHDNYVGDVFFPKWDQKEWIEVDRNDFKDYSFVTLDRLFCKTSG